MYHDNHEILYHNIFTIIVVIVASLMYICMYVLEMQQYTIRMYRYIVTCVSRYSDILHDTTKYKFINF